MIRTVLRARAFVLKVAGGLSWLPPTVARLSIGWIFIQSGWGKLHNLPKVIDYFTSLGIPAPQLQAPFVAGVEFLGGALILAGLFTRVASVPLAATMVVALVTAKRGEIASAADLYGTAEFLYIVGLTFLSAFGAGPLSFDGILVRRFAPGDNPSGQAEPPRAI
jgi:putative oxidoreductase